MWRRLAFNEIEHVAPGMLDKKRAWDTIKKMRLGIDIKHAYTAMKAHQVHPTIPSLSAL